MNKNKILKILAVVFVVLISTFTFGCEDRQVISKTITDKQYTQEYTETYRLDKREDLKVMLTIDGMWRYYLTGGGHIFYGWGGVFTGAWLITVLYSIISVIIGAIVK